MAFLQGAVSTKKRETVEAWPGHEGGGGRKRLLDVWPLVWEVVRVASFRVVKIWEMRGLPRDLMHRNVKMTT